MHTPSEPLTVSSQSGLTIGDLYECAEKLIEKHRYCVNAHSGQLDDDGLVRMDIGFNGTMVLQGNDPAFVAARAQKEVREASYQRTMELNSKKDAYRNAKIQGMCAPDP